MGEDEGQIKEADNQSLIYFSTASLSGWDKGWQSGTREEVNGTILGTCGGRVKTKSSLKTWLRSWYSVGMADKSGGLGGESAGLWWWHGRLKTRGVTILPSDQCVFHAEAPASFISQTGWHPHLSTGVPHMRPPTIQQLQIDSQDPVPTRMSLCHCDLAWQSCKKLLYASLEHFTPRRIIIILVIVASGTRLGAHMANGTDSSVHTWYSTGSLPIVWASSRSWVLEPSAGCCGPQDQRLPDPGMQSDRPSNVTSQSTTWNTSLPQFSSNMVKPVGGITCAPKATSLMVNGVSMSALGFTLFRAACEMTLYFDPVSIFTLSSFWFIVKENVVSSCFSVDEHLNSQCKKLLMSLLVPVNPAHLLCVFIIFFVCLKMCW